MSRTPPGALAQRLRLVVITDADLAAPRSVEDVVQQALDAGAPAVQLRDKAAGGGALLETATELRARTHAAGALFFVNDRLDVALACGADGVHLGPEDLPVAEARAIAGEGFLIGTSTDRPERARALVRAGADYVGCGTVYRTTTKPDAGSVIGLDGLDSVASSVPVPVVGIGGITAERVAAVARTAASGVAVVGAVMTASDVGATVRALLAPWSPAGADGA